MGLLYLYIEIPYIATVRLWPWAYGFKVIQQFCWILYQLAATNWSGIIHWNHQISQGWGLLKTISSIPLFSQFYKLIKTQRLIQYHDHTLVSVTPVKYEHDLKNVMCPLVKSEIGEIIKW